MQELLDLLTKENKESYIMGDFNIDLLKFSNHNKTNDYLENIFSLGHIPLITKPTRVTTHSATLIDHIYTSKLQEKTKSGIVVTDISDHFGIFTVILSSKKNQTTTESNLFRSFKQENIIKHF
jgi:endonuclease/exonuclease/phosphatase family metal-dependent hydrolase